MKLLYPPNRAEQLAHHKCNRAASSLSFSELRAACHAHLKAAEAAAEECPIVDIDSATRIVAAIEELVPLWDSFSPQAQESLKGAMHYFALTNDDENDFESAIGFDDDIRVLNAALFLAGRPQLTLKDYSE